MVSAPMEITWLMLMGISLLAMIVIPVLPGQFIIWLLAMVYGFLVGWDALGGWVIAILTLLMLLAAAVDAVAGWWGARRGGAGGTAIVVGLVVGFLGLIFLNAPGALLGVLLGIVAVEMLKNGKAWRSAFRAAGGYLLGLLVSLVVRFFIALVMVGVFALRVL